MDDIGEQAPDASELEFSMLYARISQLKELPFKDSLHLTKCHVTKYNHTRRTSPPANWESMFYQCLLDTPERKAAFCAYDREFAHQIFNTQRDEEGIKALIKASFPNDPLRFRSLVLEHHLEIVPYISLLNLPVREACHFVHDGKTDLKSKLDALWNIYLRQEHVTSSDVMMRVFRGYDESAQKQLRQLDALMEASTDEEEYHELCEEYNYVQRCVFGDKWQYEATHQVELQQREELSDRFIPSRMTYLVWYRFKDLLPILEESSFALLERKHKSNTLKVNAKIAGHMPAEKNDMCVILTPSQSGSSLKSRK